jgi:hypothetical protein
MSVGAVFPTAVAVYTWNPEQKSYTPPVTIDPRRGYWVAVVGPTSLNLRGVGQSAWEPALDIFAGWNMIGSVYGAPVDFSDPDDDPDGAVLSLLYRWNSGNKSYESDTAIVAGRGYWSAAVSNCTLAAGTQNPE